MATISVGGGIREQITDVKINEYIKYVIISGKFPATDHLGVITFETLPGSTEVRRGQVDVYIYIETRVEGRDTYTRRRWAERSRKRLCEKERHGQRDKRHRVTEVHCVDRNCCTRKREGFRQLKGAKSDLGLSGGRVTLAFANHNTICSNTIQEAPKTRVHWNVTCKPYFGFGWLLNCSLPLVFGSMLKNMAAGVETTTL